MFTVESYPLALVLCVITMLCWGSWANTQKLAGKAWRFELFYWDYVLGILLLSIISGLTLGSTGDSGRGFLADISQGSGSDITSALIGGVVFNLANILLVAAIAIAGMSVAFPVGIGIALVLGVIINYLTLPKGSPVLLFAGIGLVTCAIIFNALAYRKKTLGAIKVTRKGILLSVLAGLLMANFYRFVAVSMATDFTHPEAGKLTPYTAVFFMAIGVLISNFLFNTIMMRKPVEGTPVTYSDYFNGSWKNHLPGILGGMVWAIGTSLNIIASGKAGFAISYGLGQGATLIAAIWGVLVWKEFKNASPATNRLLLLMFLFYTAGLAIIVAAGV
ncbi:MAG TPA: multidrug DMT transporter permease [Bacteroidales bacterium]|nr:multidrug DMT transporter permease [Bacteroidales bacterium]